MKCSKLLDKLLPLLTVIVIIVVWGVSAVIINKDFILPTVTDVAKAFFTLFSEKFFYEALLGTIFRSLIGFICSFVLAFVLAIISVKFKRADRVVSVIMSIVRALPTIAVVLLLVVWTNSLIAPVIVTVLVVLPTTYTQIYGALIGIDKTITDAGRVDGADEKQVFLYIETPLIQQNVYRAIGSGLSLNFKLMVAAEVIAQTAKSIGLMLNVSKAYFEYARMFALVCVAVIFGLVAEFVFNKLAAKAECN